jgi:hypothetical protein
MSDQFDIDLDCDIDGLEKPINGLLKVWWEDPEDLPLDINAKQIAA